jgi:hypothetical protein
MHRNTMHPQMKSNVFSKYDIALFIHDRGKTRWKDLLQAFVENESDRHISKHLLSNYLNELCAEGLVSKTVDKQALLFKMYWKVYPIYIVPKERKKRIEEIRTRKTIYEFVDSTDQDGLKKFHESIKDI